MNFPPMMTEGSSRASRFARSLPASGWEPVVIACHWAPGAEAEQFPFEVYYAGSEFSGEESDAEQLFRFVHGLPLKSHSFLKRSAGAVRPGGNADEEAWQKNAASVATQVLQNNPEIEMIYAQAPPFAPHRLALELSSEYHLPVLFDCVAPFNADKHEMTILQSGQCVLMPSREMKEFFIRKYRDKLVREDISVVRNGYDPELCSALVTEEQAGALMRCVFHIENTDGKELKSFFSGLSNFMESPQVTRGFFSLAFIGPGYTEVSRYLDKFGLEDIVDAGPVCSHIGELELCTRADFCCMVLGKADDYECHVPERLYDLIGMNTSLGGVLPDGLTKQIIHKAGGRTVPIGEEKGIVDFLHDTLNLRYSGQLPAVPEPVAVEYDFRSAKQDFLKVLADRLPLI